MTTALVPNIYWKQPPLVAWWTGAGFTRWHLAHGDQTWCGRRIPTRRGDRQTRAHHPQVDVCRVCVQEALARTRKEDALHA